MQPAACFHRSPPGAQGPALPMLPTWRPRALPRRQCTAADLVGCDEHQQRRRQLQQRQQRV